MSPHEVIGIGVNNRVVAASMDGGESCTLRMPRRRSDTRRRTAAHAEFLNTATASNLQVAPRLLQAWYAEHKCEYFPSGLYLVSERYDMNLEEFLSERKYDDKYHMFVSTICDDVTRCLSILAQNHMYLFDLKYKNIVVRWINVSPWVQARLIDFGAEFCERYSHDDDDETVPILRCLQKKISAQNLSVVEKQHLFQHIIAMTMLVQLSAVCQFETKRTGVQNIFAEVVNVALDSMQGKNIGILRTIFRTHAVKDVLTHYLGRSRAGTGMVLYQSRGGHERGDQ